MKKLEFIYISERMWKGGIKGIGECVKGSGRVKDICRILRF